VIRLRCPKGEHLRGDQLEMKGPHRLECAAALHLCAQVAELRVGERDATCQELPVRRDGAGRHADAPQAARRSGRSARSLRRVRSTA
jgi:hypothetical protein